MQKWKTFTSSSRMWKICCAVIVRRACNWHSHQVVFLFRQVAAVISQNCHLLYILHQWMEAVLVKPIWTCSCKWHHNVCLCLLCITDCINADLLPLAFYHAFFSWSALQVLARYFSVLCSMVMTLWLIQLNLIVISILRGYLNGMCVFNWWSWQPTHAHQCTCVMIQQNWCYLP